MTFESIKRYILKNNNVNTQNCLNKKHIKLDLRRHTIKNSRHYELQTRSFRKI